MYNHKQSAMFMALLAPMFLGACSVTPSITRPSATKVTAYTRGSEVVSLDQRIRLGKKISSDWWQLFNSKPLDSVIHLAIQNNYDLKAANETMKQAQEAANAASGGLMPQLSLNALAGRQRYGVALFGPSNFSVPPFSYYEIGPALSWTPDLFGMQHHSVERQEAVAAYQAHRFEAAYLSLTGNVVETALEIASVNDELVSARQIIANDEQALSLVEETFKVGIASQVDVNNARGKLLADRSMLPSLEDRLSNSHHALSILVGKAPSEWMPPKLDLGSFALPKDLPLSLPSVLVKNRPDIQAAQANLDAARAELGMASAALYPNITITANMLQEALTPAGVFRGVAKAWAMAAGISAPLFDGGTLSAEKKGAEHAYKAALATYHQTILNAFADVADALTSLAHDDDRVKIQSGAADAASSSMHIALDKYKVGEIGLIQVQEAQRNYAQAQLRLIQSRHQQLLDYARLLVALGGTQPNRSA